MPDLCNMVVKTFLIIPAPRWESTLTAVGDPQLSNQIDSRRSDKWRLDDRAYWRRRVQTAFSARLKFHANRRNAPLLNAALALIGFDPELATLAPTARTDRSQNVWVHFQEE